MSVGTRYLTGTPSLVLQGVHTNTLLVNQSDRHMVFGLDPALDDWASLAKYEMLLVRAGVEALYGAGVRMKIPGEVARLFFTSVEEEPMDGWGAIYKRQDNAWVQEVPPIRRS